MARKTNVTINGIDYYRLRKTIGKDKNGEPIIKAFYGSSKSDAEAKYLEWLSNKNKGLKIGKDQSLTQAMYIWLWQIEKMSGNKSSTFARYEVIYRLDIDGSDLGYMSLQDVDKLAVQQHYNQMHTEGKSYSKIKNCNKLLNKFFRYCLSEGYIIRNPCFGIKFDAYKEDDELVIDEEFEDEGKIETLSEEEIKTLSQAKYNQKLKIMVKFAIGTGLRQGEILALNQSDVDLEKMQVTVAKTLSFVRVFKKDKTYTYETRVTKPKTRTSRRKVPIPLALKKDLTELKKIRIEEKLKLGSNYENNKLLFPSETGTYINPRNLVRSWQRALKQLNLPIKTFHSLRHTYASQLIKKGVDLTTVSRLMGHSSIKTTERYVHVMQSVKEEEVQKLNDLFL